MTIRERLKEFAAKLRDEAMTPDVAREVMMGVTGLLGFVQDERRAAQFDYNKVVLEHYRVSGKANRAELEANCSPQYVRLEEAKDAETLVEQSITTCRRYLTSLDTEMRLGR